MPKCKNPECGKTIPKGLNYCDADCLKRHLKLKHPKIEDKKVQESEETIWFGQGRRKRAMDTILGLAKELCPMSYNRFVCTVSYKTGLSLRKVTDDYIEVLLTIGLLKMDGSILVVVDAEKL